MAPINVFDLFAKVTLDTSAYERDVDDAADESKKLKNALDDVDDQAKKTEKSTKGLSDGFSTMKGVAADLISNGIQTVISGFGNLLSSIWNLDEATQEYTRAQGRLQTAYETSGLGAEAASEAFSAFYGILGDTDTATEASQLLAQLAKNQEDVSEWTRIAAGVSGTFGDSLPIESLIEATNETAKVGTVTGALADALNWVGIQEDDFNAKLAACSDESERNRLIMETLSGQYDDAADAFYRNSEALVASRDAQLLMQESMAKIGESVSRVKTAFASELAPALEQVTPKIVDFIESIDVETIAKSMGDFIDMLITSGPTILTIVSGIAAAFAGWKIGSLITSIISGLSSLIPALTGAATAQTGLNAAMSANPIGLILTLISGLVTAIMTLWNTNEGFRNAVTEIWANITTFLSTAAQNIAQFFTTLAAVLTTLWTNLQNTATLIWTAISTTLTTIVTTVVNTVTNLWNSLVSVVTTLTTQLSTTLQSIWTAISTFLSGIVQSIWNVIQTAWTNITTSISNALQNIYNAITSAWNNILNWLSQLPSRLWTLGVQMFTSMRDGISSIIGTVYTTIRNGIQQAIDWITSLPAQAVNWGRDMIQGFINGIASMIQSVIDTVASLASKVASYLHFSRPDVGPLHDYETWMPDFMRGLAQGITDNAYMVEEAVKGLASGMVLSPTVEAGSAASGTPGQQARPETAAGGYGGITINVYGAEGQSVNALADAVAIRLQQMTRRREKVRA